MIASVGFSASQDVDLGLEPFVELCFPVRGKYLPADHGYALFCSWVDLDSEIRKQKTVSILTVPGFPDKQGKIILNEYSCLRVRVPIPLIPLAYKLAGKSIRLGIHEIQIGIPEIFTLKPASKLKSRIVVIKGHSEPQSFLVAAQRQLDDMEISAQISIPKDRQGEFCRKTIKVKRYTIVGFTTEVSDLSDDDSIKLQQWGIGGKRHMGCGYFLPFKGGRNV
ncbi:type I-MYXAN CRISPR-associated protein Cas6/Cmx6 [Scytonema hofmannii PCC 7110]|uniref:Type I-MYXAN CRISPR-associated protein Cas6/Cmx6 n=1 Tax=Scytonema hofmannii PCC 7110 TaxID=128403 RepID=A0A139X8V6_9CYAN|nr:type I-MYXAN CRISPR-associated protein Cas6/Cmx6 [Scytonema hofmannii]KYC41072.1 type I-MYXAN CRISPR-associated protein Cas6/Cmx6 [Scytonema hofmannii PCC 7110]